jgi:aspartyl-tRNA(Asn)/glutamyl-tRNA(Gln) amidotransferase subunit A
MGRNVRDCALVLDALVGPDSRDPTTLEQPLDIFAREPRSVKGMQLALPAADQWPAFMDPGVITAWQAAARVFESLGATIVPVRLPDWYFNLSLNAGRIIASEAYALHRPYVNDAAALLGPAVRQRMQAAEAFEPGAYAQELRTMRELRRAFVEWFEHYDALLLPSAAIPAMPVAEVDEASPIPGYLTRPANYLGLCGLSQPAGLVRGLPVSLQIVGKPFAERTVLSLGQAFESATEFHRQHPDLSSLGLD